MRFPGLLARYFDQRRGRNAYIRHWDLRCNPRRLPYLLWLRRLDEVRTERASYGARRGARTQNSGRIEHCNMSSKNDERGPRAANAAKKIYGMGGGVPHTH